MVHFISRWLATRIASRIAGRLCSLALTSQAQSATWPPGLTHSIPGQHAHAGLRVAVFQYRRLGDETHPWREANDTVNRIGGWRVYAREAQQPDPAWLPNRRRRRPKRPCSPRWPSPCLPGHGGHKTPAKACAMTFPKGSHCASAAVRRTRPVRAVCGCWSCWSAPAVGGCAPSARMAASPVEQAAKDRLGKDVLATIRRRPRQHRQTGRRVVCCR